MKIKYYEGQKINDLTFIREVEPHIKPNGKKRKALFRCYCGNEFEAQISNVKNGHTKSCGCYKRQRTSETHTTHGLRNHPLYAVWNTMKARCYNPNDKRFKDWGGRGITVCDEWGEDFKAFYDFSMENGWRKGLQIDRINNNGNYEPSNCRFVTQAENNRNKRTTKLTAVDIGIIRRIKREFPHLPYKKFADVYGVSRATVGDILSNRTWENI